MLTVNLSRLHHLIKDTNDLDWVTCREIQDAQLQFVFKVFEKTTENDFEHFRAQLEKRKKQIRDNLRKHEDLLAYISYMKKIVGQTNQENGIADMLLHGVFIKRQKEVLGQFLDNLTSRHSKNLQPIMDMDFYKTAFTEENRIYDLEVWLFDEDDYDSLRKQYEMLVAEEKNLNNDIASINQETEVEIMTFEEFCEARKKDAKKGDA